MEEALGTLPRLHGEVGPRGVADEERVAGEDDPGIVSARPVGDGEAAVLGTVSRRVDAAEDYGAERYLGSVGHRVMRVLGIGRGMDAHRDAVLEREAPVPGQMIRMRVRLDHPDDARIASRGLLEVLLDRERRIDDDRVTRARVADAVGSTAERG